MRNGFLGVVATLLAGTGVTWAQMGPGAPFPGAFPEAMGQGYEEIQQGGTSPNIPPNFTGSSEPYGGIGYPPPANWEQFDPNGAPGTIRPPQPPRFWTSFEYILWYAKPGGTNYPLATTSAASDTGVIGNGTTSVLYNNNRIGFQGINGFRAMAGFWLDCDRRFGIEAGGFFTSEISSGYQINSDPNTGTPLLARPFFNTATGRQDSVVISNPSASTGLINATTTLNLWGTEANGVFNVYRSFPGDRVGIDVNAIGGIRFANVTETLTVTTVSSTLNQAGNTNTFNGQTFVDNFTQATIDQYRVINQFYGAQAGMSAEFRYARWTLNVIGKLGAGDMHETYEIAGNTVLNTSVGNIHATGGILTQSNEIGRYTRDTFAVLPELTLNFGYRFNSWLTGTFGYNLLYVSRLARPGEMIVGRADPRLQPSAPQYSFATTAPTIQYAPQTDFWLMGLNLGLSIRF